MSLVDYASSSDDDVSEDKVQEDEAEAEAEEEKSQTPNHEPSPPPTIPDHNQSFGSLNRHPESSAQPSLPPPSFEKLPDASLLLNSPTISLMSGTDHASRVSAAIAESASRKRDLNALPSSSLPRNKVPRGTLPHTKNVPDTGGGILVPPQLRGKSNIVTEDIGKLFLRRNAEPSSH